MRVDRVSDSRFERTVLLRFLDKEDEDRQKMSKECACLHDCKTDDDNALDEMEYINKHLYWRQNKLNKNLNYSPKRGDEIWARIDPDNVYVVNK